MEALNETARIDLELEQAHRDLRDMLEQVNRKVEQVEARFSPQAIIRSNTIALSLLAALLGFLAGSDERPQPFQWLAIGLLGAAFAASRNSGSDGTGE